MAVERAAANEMLVIDRRNTDGQEDRWAFGGRGCADDDERRTNRHCGADTEHTGRELPRPPGAGSGCAECLEGG
jgi:hypothetical protein